MADFSTESLSPFGVVLHASEAATDLRTLPLETIRAQVAEHRVVVLRGFAPLEGDDFPAFAGEFGKILEWDFGAVNNLQVKPDAKNYLFTPAAVPFHWDGAFVGRIPHYIIFQCEIAPPLGSGGETLFTDAIRLLAEVAPEERAVWENIRITYSTEKIVHYGGSFTAALIGQHPITGEAVVRYAEPVNDLNPVTLRIEGIAEADQPAFLERMHSPLYRQDRCLAFVWQQGDFVIADNHATLHGRNAFTQPERRHIRRVNVL